jgi:hypothetical protein
MIAEACVLIGGYGGGFIAGPVAVILTPILTPIISVFIILYIVLWAKNIKDALFVYNSIILVVIASILGVIAYHIIYHNFNINKVNHNIFTKKVGYSGLYCETYEFNDCKRFSLPKKYDELKRLESPYDPRYRYDNKHHCPYFIARIDNKNVLIDKNDHKFLDEYDDVEEIEHLPFRFLDFILKVKKDNKYGLYRLDSSHCSDKKLIVPIEYNAIEHKTILENHRDYDVNLFDIIIASKDKTKDVYIIYPGSSPKIKFVYKDIEKFEVPNDQTISASWIENKIKISEQDLNKLEKERYSCEFKKIIVDGEIEYICDNNKPYKLGEFMFLRKKDKTSDTYDLFIY